jgi:hypothetical protein
MTKVDLGMNKNEGGSKSDQERCTYFQNQFGCGERSLRPHRHCHLLQSGSIPSKRISPFFDSKVLALLYHDVKRRDHWRLFDSRCLSYPGFWLDLNELRRNGEDRCDQDEYRGNYTDSAHTQPPYRISFRLKQFPTQRGLADWVSDAQVRRNHAIIRKYSASSTSLR